MIIDVYPFIIKEFLKIYNICPDRYRYDCQPVMAQSTKFNHKLDKKIEKKNHKEQFATGHDLKAHHKKKPRHILLFKARGLTLKLIWFAPRAEVDLVHFEVGLGCAWQFRAVATSQTL